MSDATGAGSVIRVVRRQHAHNHYIMAEYENNRNLTALTKYMEHLHTYSVWYAKSVRRYAVAYYGLQFGVMLCGFLTAVLAAFETQIGVWWTKPAIVILPLLGSLSVGALYQFRVYDLWRIREDGRLAFQDLDTEVRRRLAAASGEADCGRAYEELQQQATKIERDQADRFYAVRDSKFLATFTKTP
jgi:hypothetical protein